MSSLFEGLSKPAEDEAKVFSDRRNERIAWTAEVAPVISSTLQELRSYLNNDPQFGVDGKIEYKIFDADFWRTSREAGKTWYVCPDIVGSPNLSPGDDLISYLDILFISIPTDDKSDFPPTIIMKTSGKKAGRVALNKVSELLEKPDYTPDVFRQTLLALLQKAQG